MPLSGLPSIDDPAIIDGATQPGYAGKPIIELDGSQSGNEVALSIGAGGSTVRGLVINRFAGGIFISGGGGNHIEGNYIGTDVTGTLALGNQYNGIAIESSSSNTIGGTTTGAGNVIVASGLDGIEVNGTGEHDPGQLHRRRSRRLDRARQQGERNSFHQFRTIRSAGPLPARATSSPAMARTVSTTRTAQGSSSRATRSAPTRRA